MATFKNAHFELTTDDARKVVTLVRSKHPFRTVGEMIGVLDDIMHAVEGIDGNVYGLVVDNREGPVRIDDSFQKAFRSFRTRLDERFVRVGVVLATDPGVKSLEDQGPSPNVRVYKELEPAIAWAEDGRE
jgi:hypothetical protein